MTSEDIIKITSNALNDKKCKELNILKVEELTSLCEYFVIANATSLTHVRSLADEVEEQMKNNGVEPYHIEGKNSGWVILDYKSVLVHIFTPDKREFYNLDKMWNDAKSVDLDKILNNAQGD